MNHAVQFLALSIFAVIARRCDHQNALVVQLAHGQTQRVHRIAVDRRCAEAQVDDINFVL